MTSPKVPEHSNKIECVTVEGGMSEVKLTPLTSDSSALKLGVNCFYLDISILTDPREMLQVSSSVN